MTSNDRQDEGSLGKAGYAYRDYRTGSDTIMFIPLSTIKLLPDPIVISVAIAL